jgi:hypothetical protein
MRVRTDRPGLILAQSETSCEIARSCLATITDLEHIMPFSS